MQANPFVDRDAPPSAQALQATLGRASALWTQLRAELAAAHEPLTDEWTFPGKSGGWALRLKRKSRAIVYLVPRRGFFLAAFVLGEKACAVARERPLPAPVLEAIENAPRYPEGRGVRLEIRAKKDVASAVVLAGIKMST